MNSNAPPEVNLVKEIDRCGLHKSENPVYPPGTGHQVSFLQQIDT